MEHLIHESLAPGTALTEPAGPARPAAPCPPRTAEPRPNPGPFQPAVRLALQPRAQPLHYAVTARWEERIGGEVTRTVVAKRVALSSTQQPDGPHLLVTLETAPPALRKRDLLPQEEMVLLLAGLYGKLVLETAPTGQLLALANHAEIGPVWAGIKQAFGARYGAQDENAAALAAAVEAQVQDPARLFDSLQYDYAYRLLVANLYEQRLESGFGYGQPRAFPEFLAGTAVHFHERLELGVAAAPGQVRVLLSGRLDEQRTDRAAAARQVAAALALVPTTPAPDPPDPADLLFSYVATYDLDAATGWPVAVEAVVTCQSPAGYAKEYDLTIELL